MPPVRSTTRSRPRSSPRTAINPNTAPTPGERLGRAATESWQAVERLIKDSMIRSLEALNVSRRSEVKRLSAQIFDLERRLRDTRQRLKSQITYLTDALTVSQAERQNLVDEQTGLRSLAMIGELVPALAHDLNTPIANSLLVVETLSGRLREFQLLVDRGELRRSDLTCFVDELGDGLAILRSTSEQSADLSVGLKHLSIDVASLRRRDFTMNDLIDNVVHVMKPTLRQSQLMVEVKMTDRILMDSYPGALGQVLTNLLQNVVIHAFDAPHPNAHVCIDARLIKRNKVRISVTDNGCGMTRAVQDQLFTPYFTTALKRGGSGVGLHGVRQLVTGLLGGSISVSSKVGAGSCFVIEIPLKAPSAKSG